MTGGILLGVLCVAFAAHVDVSVGPKDPSVFSRLQAAADDCRETGRELRCQLPDGLLENEARRLADVALAYGAERISPRRAGNPLSRRIADFRRCDTHRVGFSDAGSEALDTGFFTSVRTDEKGPLVIGEFVTRDESTGERALYVCSVAGGGAGKVRTLRFRSLLPDVAAVGADGKITVETGTNHTYCLTFPADGAVLVTAKDFGDHSTCPEYLIKTGQIDENCRDEAHIADIAAAGIDVVGDYFDGDIPAFDIFAKYGIRVVDYKALPNFWGGHTNMNGRLAELWPREKYRTHVKQHFVDHPALWGASPSDEPSSLDFPFLADGMRVAYEKNPNVRMYHNLHPCTQFRRELYFGVSNYVAYLDAYVKTTPVDHICFDVYPYSRGGNGGGLRFYYQNYRHVADFCRRTGRMLWTASQLNNNNTNLFVNENMMRYQAHGGLAFGAEMQGWGCWCPRWWYGNVLDTNGVKTVQYERVKRVNAELKTIAKEYMRFRSVSTHFTGFDREPFAAFLEPHPALQIPKVNFNEPGKVDLGFFDGVRAMDDGPIVVSLMAPRKAAAGSRAMLVFAADDPLGVNEKVREVVFTTDLENVRAFGGEGAVPVTRRIDGSYTLSLKSSRSVLVVADEPKDPEARVVYEGNRAFIEINGERMEPDLNLDWSHCPQGDAFDAKIFDLGVMIAECGLWVSRGVERDDGTYDFSKLDKSARDLVMRLPGVKIYMGVWLDFPKWCAKHPEECIGYADGPAEKGSDEHSGRPVRPSAASKAFHAEVARFLAELGRYVRAQPWGKDVVMVRPAWGVYCEWHYWGMYHFPDTGKAMTEAFHAFDGGKWAGASLPTVEERIAGGGALDPVKDAKTLAYYRCMAETTSDFLLFCCRETKRAFPGRLVGAYYGYVMAHHPPEGATVMLDKVLASPDVDFLSSPSMYTVGSRRAGGSYYSRTIPATFRRYGKLAIIEDDMRFHHIKPFITSDSGRAICTVTPRESQMTMRRDYLNRLFDGTGLQFNDPMSDTFGKRPHAFDDPSVLIGLREAMEVVRRVGRVEPDSGNELAVVVDPLERLQRSAKPSSDYQHGRVFVMQEFARRTGVSFDLLTEEDFAATKNRYAKVLHLRNLVDRVPYSVPEWRAYFHKMGVKAIAKEGTYVRRQGNLILYHCADAGWQTIDVPDDLRGRKAVELFSGNDFSGDRITFKTEGCDTRLFRFYDKITNK